MSEWEETLKKYGGEEGLYWTLDNEGIGYFVADHIGSSAFRGGPLEEAAVKIATGIATFQAWCEGIGETLDT